MSTQVDQGVDLLNAESSMRTYALISLLLFTQVHPIACSGRDSPPRNPVADNNQVQEQEAQHHPPQPPTLFNLNMRINDLNTDGACHENDVNWSLHECITLRHPVGFQTIMALCGHELPYKSDRFKEMHARLWTSTGSCNEDMLETLYKDGRCQTYELLTSLAKYVLPAHRELVKLFLPRLVRVRRACPDVEANTMSDLISQVPAYRIGALKMLRGWRARLDALTPQWPYANFLTKKRPKGITHMASLAAYANDNCERFTLPFFPYRVVALDEPYGIYLGGMAAFMGQHSATLSTFNIIYDSHKDFEKKMPHHSSYGRYRRNGPNLQVLTKGDIGVWMVRLVGDGELMKRLEVVCDSLLGDADCNNDSYALPTDPKTSLVIVMGRRPIFRNHNNLLDTLSSGLLSSDVEEFQRDIKLWFKKFSCSQEHEQPALLTSMFFYH